MRGRALLVAGLVLAGGPLAVADADDLAARNRAMARALLGVGTDAPREAHEAALRIADRATALGLAMPAQAEAARPGDLHGGDILYACAADWAPCPPWSVTFATPSAPSCFVLPLHDAFYGYYQRIGAGEVPAGFLILWTEAALGLAPLVVFVEGGTFTGSFCTFQVFWVLEIRLNGTFEVA